MIPSTDEQVIGKTKENYLSFYKNTQDVAPEANNNKPHFVDLRNKSKSRTLLKSILSQAAPLLAPFSTRKN